jgi:hypothetical protein
MDECEKHAQQNEPDTMGDYYVSTYAKSRKDKTKL